MSPLGRPRTEALCHAVTMRIRIEGVVSTSQRSDPAPSDDPWLHWQYSACARETPRAPIGNDIESQYAGSLDRVILVSPTERRLLVKIRASVILLCGATILAGISNASAGGHPNGASEGGHFAFQSRPFVDHRFVDRRFFFAQRPFIEHRRVFFAQRPFFQNRRVFAARPSFVPRQVFVAPPPAIGVAPALPSVGMGPSR